MFNTGAEANAEPTRSIKGLRIMTVTRRDFWKLALAGGATGTVGAPVAAFATGPAARPADLPKPKGPRIVVVGGGWSGLSLAKTLKREDARLDVVLIEPRATFFSCPLSNLWLADLVTLETLVRSYLDAAVAGGYLYFNATLVDLDREKRRAHTERGWIGYDALVLAPGIDYDYAAMGVTDPTAQATMAARYPAGFRFGSEHLSLGRKIAAFKGGIFALNAPPGIYRCTASVYERACLIAAKFKKARIKGKVVLLDPRAEPTVNVGGFLTAFKDLHADHLEYMPSTEINGVDPESRRIKTTFDDVAFDDAAFYPRVRGAVLLETLGLVDPKSAQKEARIDPLTNAVVGDERVFVAGDARPMPFAKGGEVARTEALHLAKRIVAMLHGKTVPWQSPVSICYSVVNDAPVEAVVNRSTYRFDMATRQFDFAEAASDNTRSATLGRAAIDWGNRHLDDMFATN